ncbi:MAG: tRNA (adenosine(37)-N6)-threonylcarbamoyltransferase complex ATPase subunit type 1 TsaE [Patescibacteria group bacterium]
MDTIDFKTNSSKQTRLIAKSLAQEILQKKIKIKSALVLTLSGNLGGGKTTFVQGFMKGAGVKKKITSPTFVLIKSYETNKTYWSHRSIYHIDCYRFRKAKELLDLGLKEIFKNPKNIVLIEWPEKIKKHLPKNHILIKFRHSKKENERIISIKYQASSIKRQ